MFVTFQGLRTGIVEITIPLSFRIQLYPRIFPKYLNWKSLESLRASFLLRSSIVLDWEFNTLSTFLLFHFLPFPSFPCLSSFPNSQVPRIMRFIHKSFVFLYKLLVLLLNKLKPVYKILKLNILRLPLGL